MSELIQTNDNRATIRWKLLTGVSALTLIASLGAAKADDADRPTVWIELGGQLDRINGKEDPFLPLFALLSPAPGPYSPLSPAEAQKSSIYTFGEQGKITFQPEGSNWDFSASIRYGRSNNSRHSHQQSNAITTYPNTKFHGTSGVSPYKTAKEPVFADFTVRNSESHAIVDFQVGRDVGMGAFSTTFDAGIRAVDFASQSRVGMIARPHVQFHVKKIFKYYEHVAAHTDYMASGYDTRGFRGIGPSLSWSGDVPIAGNEDGALTFDWGVNAAALFGRQKAKGSHKTSANYYSNNYNVNLGVSVYNHPPLMHDRTRSVVVPNVGALAGISLRYADAKISFGYRADLFLGAMDMGIDARDTKDRNFYGPFATISVGLGD